jgi:hypothetical protein
VLSKENTDLPFLASWPTGKAKYRKIRATRQETSDSEEAETQSGQELFVPGPAQRAKWRKSEPVKATKVDEYDEDPGREESQYVFTPRLRVGRLCDMC